MAEGKIVVSEAEGERVYPTPGSHNDRFVGPGWHWLTQLLTLLADSEESCRVVQVKEKFGGLRFYTEGESKTLSDVIWAAEGLTQIICEECGKLGRSRPGGWVKTLCDKCWEER